MRWLSALVVLTIVLGASLAVSAESLVGKWKTVDDKSGKVESEVQLYEEGGKLFGKIVGLSEPNDDMGKPKTCTKCTGADKDKPIVGLVIIAASARRRDGHQPPSWSSRAFASSRSFVSNPSVKDA